MVSPGRGFLEQEFDRSYPTVMTIEDGHVVLPSGIRLPLNPSMGLVATTPTYPQLTASDSGPYGGDIDIKELVAGSTLYLPVFVEGGLLAMGDCHAVVGDGAVGGTGAECAADSHIRVTVEKGMGIESPRAITPDYFVVLYYGEELGPAMKGAVRSMVDFLVQEKGTGTVRRLHPVQPGGRRADVAHLPAHQPRQDDAGPPRPRAAGVGVR